VLFQPCCSNRGSGPAVDGPALSNSRGWLRARAAARRVSSPAASPATGTPARAAAGRVASTRPVRVPARALAASERLFFLKAGGHGHTPGDGDGDEDEDG
jgi:hypothetical protein